MKITTSKQIIDQMERCYALAMLETKSGTKCLVASEAHNGSSVLYSGENYEEREIIWENVGGTMSIVPLSDTTSETESFLISQHYFPGFDAKESSIVKVSKKNGEWIQEEVMVLPYLHRFELIEVQGQTYIVCATLCTWKTAREDWSSPGHVFVGRYHRETNEITNFRLVLSNLTQNHGMSKLVENNQESILISAKEGIYVIRVEEGTYRYEKQFAISSSETIFVDINNDGVDEVITIEPFHGDVIGIYDNQGELIQQLKRKTQFLHSLWGGKVLNKHIFICGGRRGEANLFVAYMNEEGKLEEFVIDSGNGSANIVVKQTGNALKIVSANNSNNEIAMYTLTFSEK